MCWITERDWQEQLKLMCSYCIITSIMAGYVWATLPESLICLISLWPDFELMQWSEWLVYFSSFSQRLFPGFRNDCKGSPEVERWFCRTKNRAAQAVRWTEITSWKRVGRPLRKHEDGGMPLHRLATERCCYNHAKCCLSSPGGAGGLITSFTRNTVTRWVLTAVSVCMYRNTAADYLVLVAVIHSFLSLRSQYVWLTGNLSVSLSHSESQNSGDCLLPGLSVENSQWFLHYFTVFFFLIPLKTSLPLACFALSKRREELVFVFCVNTEALLHQTQSSTGLLSHTQNLQTVGKNGCQNSFLFLSHPCPFIALLLFVLRREMPWISRGGVLGWQVSYDQFIHFIPNLSRDLKIFGFIVIVKWTGETTHKSG